jgi:hypothetical protein
MRFVSGSRGLDDPSYVELNIRDLFRGSALIEIDEELNIKLNKKGIESYKNDEIA